jgi:hypothetical protein
MKYECFRPRIHRSIDAPWEDSSTAIPPEIRMEIREPVIIYCLSEEKENDDCKFPMMNGMGL